MNSEETPLVKGQEGSINVKGDKVEKKEGTAGILDSTFNLASLNEDCKSFQELTGVYLGKGAVIFSEILFILNLTGACSAYLIIVGDSIEPAMDYFIGSDFYLSNRHVIILIVAFIVIWPLTLLREISKLGFTSFIAITGVIYLTILLIVATIQYFVNGNPMPEGVREWMFFNPNLYSGFMPMAFLSVPIIAFSFQGIELVAVPIYFELKNKTLMKMVVIIVGALSISCTAYIIIGVLGFIRFGKNTEANILVSFGQEYIAAYFARLLLGLTVTFSFPLYVFAERLAIHSMIGKWLNEKEKMSTATWLIVTFLCFSVALILPMLLTDISDILGLIGSFGAITFIFIYPMMILFQILRKTKMNLIVRILSYIGIFIIIVIALILLVAGDLVTILKMLHEYGVLK